MCLGIPNRIVDALRRRKLTLPYPEEPMNPAATVDNIDVAAILRQWLVNYRVPAEHWDYWLNQIDIQVYDVYPESMGMSQDTPAGTWESGGIRHLAIKAKWLNPGVIAHEQAHNSYAMLTPEERIEFGFEFEDAKGQPLVKLMMEKTRYWLESRVEAHAEVARFLGPLMPVSLRKFYPRLF